MADTDRELLELAAKAAGYKVSQHHQSARDAAIDPATASLWIDGVSTGWNPLKDDGDALRLAVRTGEPFVVRTRCVTTMGGLKEDFDPALAGDDLRAVRRVIVRAAAAIGGGK